MCKYSARHNYIAVWLEISKLQVYDIQSVELIILMQQLAQFDLVLSITVKTFQKHQDRSK